MVLTVIAVVLVVIGITGAVWWRRREQNRLLLLEHTIGPDELYRALSSPKPPRVYDVRQPLELLAYSEIIPASERVPPKELLANPSLIPRDVDSVVYCTCAADETAIEIVKKALALQFVRVKLLRGGLGAWKAKGYPVTRYDTVFHLDTPA